MLVIKALEENIHSLYDHYILSFYPDSDGEKVLSLFQERCLSAKIPLAAQIRLEDLVKEYLPKFQDANKFTSIDQMTGAEFERWCAGLLIKCGYTSISVTGSSGDQGVDITATKDEIHYAIQCKCYSSKLGNKPIQEVFAGKQMYNCQIGVVMTNSTFTSGAKELAERNGVLLWDREKLKAMFTLSQNDNHACAAESKMDPSLEKRAIRIAMNTEVIKPQLLQRELRIGYSHASDLLAKMETMGIVGPQQEDGSRHVLISGKELYMSAKET